MRYYSYEDPEIGVTPSQLKRMRLERQWPYVRHWFLRMFEDPANETPRMDGDFEYIWGGPYDALEELQQEFPDFPDDRVEEFAQRLEAERGVINWAPGRDHPDHDRENDAHRVEKNPRPQLNEIIETLSNGIRPQFGSTSELTQRDEILRRLDELNDQLVALSGQAAPHAGIGHNRPPQDAAHELYVDLHTAQEVTSALRDIQRELSKPTPNARSVAGRTSYIDKLLTGLAVGIPVAIVTGAAQQITKTVVSNHPEIAIAVNELVNSVVQWLCLVIPPTF